MFISEKNISTYLREYYGLKGNLTTLSGYEDQNLILETDNHQKYIVKISKEAGNLSFLEAQIKVARKLSYGKLNGYFPEFQARKDSEFIGRIQYEGIVYNLWVLSYLEGDFWIDVDEKMDTLYERLGSFLGIMDHDLTGLHPDGAYRYSEWNNNRALEVENYLHFIKNHEKRRIAAYFLMQFRTEVLPLIPELRHSVIHGDANDFNILVRDQKVSGLIDFGDLVWSATIQNLAIACTYAIMRCNNPLEKAVLIVKAYHKQFTLQEKETDILYYLITGRLCVSVCQSAKNAAQNSDNEHHFLSEKPAWDLLYRLLEINPVKAANEFRKACGFEPIIKEKDDYETLIKRRKNSIGYNLSLSYKNPIKITKGALQYLYDDRGNTFIDCVNNVSHVGHSHPVLVKALQKQIATLNTNSRYLSDLIIDYAEALTKKLPSKLKVCYFVNSGSEANDLAIRMARNFTSKNDIIVLDHAYHGTSTLALEMSPYKFDGKGGKGQKPYIHKAVSPDLYRGPYLKEDKKAGEKYAQNLIEVFNQTGPHIAAFICETLLGVGGQMPLPEGYLKEVYQIVRENGGVCIADEVQVGFGRVGSTFWGFQLQDVEPDIVVMGKPMGNGHPLAAVVVTEEIAATFNNGMEYFNTYGGNPVSMVAGKTILEIIENEELQENAKKMGKILLEGLSQLKEKHEIIGDVRGQGLFAGAEFVKNRKSKEPAVEELNRVVEKMKERGFLLSTDGPLNNVLKIKPPLVITESNIREMIENLDEILHQKANPALPQ